jgi:glycosyltransferase involved in cell wall biosynthesis
MKNEILFLAPYPTPENCKDGAISRVNAIDNMFKGNKRIYWDVALFKHWHKEHRIENEVDIFQLNSFLHCLFIIKGLLSINKIYSHSILGCLGIFYVLPFIHKCIVLDAHGVVPEEIGIYSEKRKWLKTFLNCLEYYVIKKTILIICVTNRMKSHYQKKYTWYEGNYMVYNTLPKIILDNIDEQAIKKAKSSSDITIIYSGGISPWQNIDLMLESIKKCTNKSITYILLVSNPEYVKRKLEQYELNGVTVISVMPQELKKYYEKADYAFVLRDDNIVNRVANPNKIVEYLANGILPIVLTKEIGDYSSRGFEYLDLEEYINNVKKPLSLSTKNIAIARDLINENARLNIIDTILGLWQSRDKV